MLHGKSPDSRSERTWLEKTLLIICQITAILNRTRMSSTHMIIAQAKSIRKSNRLGSDRRLSHILSTSGNANSCDISSVIHLKKSKTFKTTPKIYLNSS